MFTILVEAKKTGWDTLVHPERQSRAAVLFRQLGVALLYGLLARLALTYFSPNDMGGIFWPASGLALAVLLMGGRRYALGIFLGAVLGGFTAGRPLWMLPVMAIGPTLGALVAHWLLTRDTRFDPGFRTMGDYLRLMALAGLLGGGVGALIRVTSLQVYGVLMPAAYAQHLLHWWMGDALGMVLVTPLILIWRRMPDPWPARRRWLEIVLMLALSLLWGQVIFLGWLSGTVGLVVSHGFWMFLFVAWAALRLGTHGVTLILCMATVQVLLGSHFDIGFFAGDMVRTRLFNTWSYLMSLCMVGMLLTTYRSGQQRSEASLRIAAIAFECQEGMIITDAHQVILRVNRSFTRIMGYTDAEVVGRTTALMRSDRHDAAFYDAIWAESADVTTWQGEIWHRRKNGEVFPQWVTSTAVMDEYGRITHFVVTHVDITGQKQQEARRQAHEAVQRDALVREVHHRIKNNLQGITGVLRQFAQRHPETAEPINQVIGQVRTIAVIHGLQGRASLVQVRLCELTGAIAAEIQALWQTTVQVDIPPDWLPCIIAETEAVPVALVLHELILNAVKHGGKNHGGVRITLGKGVRPDVVQVRMLNTGHWQPASGAGTTSKTGRQLVAALMPRQGARFVMEQQGSQVVTLLELSPPVLNLEPGEPE